ncbi:MAG: hypothetical protein KDA28_13975 [Phycisphaerales bacterium]|nr:hypothetical protein [Phycisphaerales bacterium]
MIRSGRVYGTRIWRSGVHGRGFAVVADEVRKLAECTTTATREIASSIMAIQEETGKAVVRMNTGTDEVTVGVERAEQAGRALQQIVTSAGDVTSMVQSIAAASEQQSKASREFTRDIEKIASVTRQTSDGTSRTAAAAAQLSEQAQSLQRLVGQFRTSST